MCSLALCIMCTAGHFQFLNTKVLHELLEIARGKRMRLIYQSNEVWDQKLNIYLARYSSPLSPSTWIVTSTLQALLTDNALFSRYSYELVYKTKRATDFCTRFYCKVSESRVTKIAEININKLNKWMCNKYWWIISCKPAAFCRKTFTFSCAI